MCKLLFYAVFNVISVIRDNQRTCPCIFCNFLTSILHRISFPNEWIIRGKGEEGIVLQRLSSVPAELLIRTRYFLISSVVRHRTLRASGRKKILRLICCEVYYAQFKLTQHFMVYFQFFYSCFWLYFKSLKVPFTTLVALLASVD